MGSPTNGGKDLSLWLLGAVFSALLLLFGAFGQHLENQQAEMERGIAECKTKTSVNEARVMSVDRDLQEIKQDLKKILRRLPSGGMHE